MYEWRVYCARIGKVTGYFVKDAGDFAFGTAEIEPKPTCRVRESVRSATLASTAFNRLMVSVSHLASWACIVDTSYLQTCIQYNQKSEKARSDYMLPIRHV
jgi:hypothetical protein